MEKNEKMKTLRIFREFEKKKKKREWVCHKNLQIRALKKKKARGEYFALPEIPPTSATRPATRTSNGYMRAPLGP